MRTIHNLRHGYRGERIAESKLPRSPLPLLRDWVREALRSKNLEPNAMTLSTVGARGYPSSRVVLCRGIDRRGLWFYTNYESRKGREVSRNRRVSLCFYWPELNRQIRIEGTISKAPPRVSDRYFLSRPYGSQLGAWASPQSNVIQSRDTLEERLEHFRQRYPEGDVPRPPHWGGYVVHPTRVEFWAGDPARLHDRFEYLRVGAQWRKRRLAP